MDWQISTVVVGIDGSEGSNRAAEHGAAIARHWGAHLKLVTVVRTPEGWWGIGGAPPSPEALSTALIEGQQKILQDISSHLDLDGIDYETVEELGDPVSRLIAVCEINDADLLVIGRRGAGLAERVILGSTADRLTHLAPCPVLVIP
ncbi:MAG TPA: universal stress protein [Acidimicrobiia bacterium]|jgi:nucleotide-binding universal stress UspA family protein|nr:universal stress protein [Acidimicrobiia bacterium]